MNFYETVVVTKPTTSSKELDEIRSYIEDKVGKITKHEMWGSKTLAYPIKKETKGTYAYFIYEAEPSRIAPFTNWLKIQPTVLRHLVIKRRAS